MQDKPILTDVKLIKIDKDTKEMIKSDFSFGIYEDAECTKLITEVKCDKEIASVLFKELRYSIMYIKELSAPEGYELSNKIVKLEINDKGVFADNIELAKQDETYSFEFENEKEKIPDVDIEKTGIIQTTANEEIRYNFHIKNTGNVALSNFTWYDYLPSDYVTMQKLITGTYNQDLNYSIYYKTNLNDYKLLAENLNTQVNNYIDFSNIALEEGEIITEFKADFGTVDVGFESVINPYIFVKVRSEVKNNDTFTNKTKIEGKYKEYVVWDEDDHTTKVYEKKLNLKKLPRTGC